jgi:hypothetical protein
MIVLDVEDVQQLALVVGFDGEREPVLLVETQGILAANAPPSFELLEVQALHCAEVVFMAGGNDHRHFVEKRICDSRRVSFDACFVGVKRLKFLAGKRESRRALSV